MISLNQRHRKVLLLFALIILGCTSQKMHAQAARGGPLFIANMNGAQEVPAVSTTGQGIVGFSLNPAMNELWINGSVTGLSGRITGAHIHRGPMDSSGPVLIGIDSASIHGNRFSMKISGSKLTPQLLSMMAGGKTYFNVHTVNHPNGEIRGQIMLAGNMTFMGMMDGRQETPPNSSSARGLAVAWLSMDSSILNVHAVYGMLSSSVKGAHIHSAPPGKSGPVKINLGSFIKGNSIMAEIPASGLSRGLLDSIIKGLTYINVHTDSFPNGEIRGQMMMMPGMNFIGNMDSKQETTGSTSSGNGLAFVYSSPMMDTLHYAVAIANLSQDTPTAAHFHVSPPGKAGPVVMPFSNFNGVMYSGDITGANRDSLLKGLMAGDIYANVHSKANPGGEIRGQMMGTAATGYLFDICAQQEVPSKNLMAGGTGYFLLGNMEGMLMASVDSMTGPITAAHIHKEVIGKSGPVVLPLSHTGGMLNGHWFAKDTASKFDSTLVADLMAGNLYVNAHTTANSGGETRGQIVNESLCSSVTGIEEKQEAVSSLNLFPMPVNEILNVNIKAGSSSNCNIQILDLQGRRVQMLTFGVNTEENPLKINVTQLPKGMYILHLLNGNQNLNSRFIKE